MSRRRSFVLLAALALASVSFGATRANAATTKHPESLLILATADVRGMVASVKA